MPSVNFQKSRVRLLSDFGADSAIGKFAGLQPDLMTKEEFIAVADVLVSLLELKEVTPSQSVGSRTAKAEFGDDERLLHSGGRAIG